MGSSAWWLPWVVYGPMAALGAVWASLARGSVFGSSQPGWLHPSAGWAISIGLLLAVVLSAATVFATRILVEHTGWARRLHLELRTTLHGITPARILLLSLLSAFGEELFFRAALTPSVGLVPGALLFGLVHVSPRGTYFAWSLWAAVMGLLFALLFSASGSLLVPIVAHALINYENMHYISNYDPTPLDIDRLSAQRSRSPRV